MLKKSSIWSYVEELFGNVVRSQEARILWFPFLGVLKSLINLNLCKGPEVMSSLEENAEKPIFFGLDDIGWLSRLARLASARHTAAAAELGRSSKISFSARE